MVLLLLGSIINFLDKMQRIITLISAVQRWFHNLNMFYSNANLTLEDEVSEHTAILLTRFNDTVVRTFGYVENVALQYDFTQFQQHFRITREMYDRLLGIVTPSLQNNCGYGRPTVPPKTQLLSVLWLLATPDSYRSVADRFGIGKSSLHHSFVRVVHVLNTLAPQQIKWPQTQQEIYEAVDGFRRSGINNIIGAIDGSYIPIKAPKYYPESYICRKRFHAVTLQAICTYNLKFTDCFVGYPSSVNDFRIFKNSIIYQEIIRTPYHYFPNDEFIIGDKAYPVRRWCITPYINSGHLTRRQIHFNTVLSQCRQAIERSFALLKGRFRRLKYLDMTNIALVPATILSCCVLHNLCLQHDDVELENYILEGMEAEANDQNNQDHVEVDEPNFFDETGILRRDRIALSL